MRQVYQHHANDSKKENLKTHLKMKMQTLNFSKISFEKKSEEITIFKITLANQTVF